MFPMFLQLFICLPTQCPQGLRDGVVKQKKTGVDRGRGLKIGKNVWTSFVHDPL